MTYYQVNYRVPGYFYTLTKYDLESDNEEVIREEIAENESCNPEDIELFMDSIRSYRG